MIFYLIVLKVKFYVEKRNSVIHFLFNYARGLEVNKYGGRIIELLTFAPYHQQKKQFPESFLNLEYEYEWK